MIASRREKVVAQLPQRPLVLFDWEYGCGKLVLQTADLAADKLMRLRSNRCLYSAPPAYPGRGRPRLVWQEYLRRFAIDHWYRFAKQTLHWTLPHHLSTPEQSDRWSDLMPLLTWQLWLAQDLVRDDHLPWQKPSPQFLTGSLFLSLNSIYHS